MTQQRLGRSQLSANATNSLHIKRHWKGEVILGVATYSEEHDGWYCSVRYSRGVMLESRGPVNDCWTELMDMIDLAMTHSYDKDR